MLTRSKCTEGDDQDQPGCASVVPEARTKGGAAEDGKIRGLFRHREGRRRGDSAKRRKYIVYSYTACMHATLTCVAKINGT